MILSEQHRFVFIKGRKVAGTSLEVMLSAVCGAEDIITPILAVDERRRLAAGQRGAQNFHPDQRVVHNYLQRVRSANKDQLAAEGVPNSAYHNHMSLRQVEAQYGCTPNDWRVFAVERCPYRKVISFVNMQMQFEHYRRTGKAMVTNLDALKQGMDYFIKHQHIKRVRNIDLYKGRDGLVTAQILRYETLVGDIEHLMAQLKIGVYPSLGHFKKGLLSNQLDLHSVLKPDQIAVINDVFADEFAAFGYQIQT